MLLKILMPFVSICIKIPIYESLGSLGSAKENKLTLEKKINLLQDGQPVSNF